MLQFFRSPEQKALRRQLQEAKQWVRRKENTEKATALHYAAEHDNEALVIEILQASVKKRKQGTLRADHVADKNGKFAIDYAADKRCLSALKALLISTSGLEPSTPFRPLMHEAIDRNDRELAEIVGNAAPNYLRYTPPGREPPLEYALECRCESIVAFLANKLNATLMVTDGTTPLTLAVQHDLLSSLRVLIAEGAWPASNGALSILLRMAISKKKKELVDIFIESPKWLPEAVDILVVTSAVDAGNEELAMALVLQGYKVNETRFSGSTALHAAVDHKMVDLAKLLVSKGAAADIRNSSQHSPFYLAMKQPDSNREFIDLFISKCPQEAAYCVDGRGESLLHTAVRSKSTWAIEKLAKHTPQLQLAKPGEHTVQPFKFVAESGSPIDLAIRISDASCLEALLLNLPQTYMIHEALVVRAIPKPRMLEILVRLHYSSTYFSTSRLERVIALPSVLAVLKEAGLQFSDPWRNAQLLHAATKRQAVDSLKLLFSYGVEISEPDSNIIHHAKLHLATIDLLLNHGADANSLSTDGKSLLTLAILAADIDLMDVLFRHGAKHNAQDLHHAKLHLATIELLLNHGADANSLSTDGKSLLTRAILAADIDLMDVLFRHGAKHDAQDLHHAAKNQGALERLISHGTDINARWNGCTILENAARERDTAFVFFLVQHGAVFSTDVAGQLLGPLLHRYITTLKDAEQLLLLGADPLLIVEGRSFFQKAVYAAFRPPAHDHHDWIKLLDVITDGLGNVVYQDEISKSALSWLIEAGPDDTLQEQVNVFIEKLVQIGLNLGSQDQAGNTLLMTNIATSGPILDALLATVKRTPQILDAKSFTGRTALHHAAQCCNTRVTRTIILQSPILKKLLCRSDEVCTQAKSMDKLPQADIAAVKSWLRDSSDQTPLHLAVQTRNSGACTGILQFLGELVVDERDSKGKTALSYAVDVGSADTANILLKHGADPKLGGDIRTLMRFAAAKYDHATLKVLCEHDKTVVTGANAQKLMELVISCPNQRNRKVCMMTLLRYGIDNASPNGTVYHIGLRVSIAAGDEHLVRVCIEFGADVNWCSDPTERPLVLAAQLVRKDAGAGRRILSMLFFYGATMSELEGFSAHPGARPSWPKVFAEFGLEKDTSIPDGRTLLELLLLKDYGDLVEFLLKRAEQSSKGLCAATQLLKVDVDPNTSLTIRKCIMDKALATENSSYLIALIEHEPKWTPENHAWEYVDKHMFGTYLPAHEALFLYCVVREMYDAILALLDNGHFLGLQSRRIFKDKTALQLVVFQQERKGTGSEAKAKVVKAFVRKGADPFLPGNEQNHTSAHIAVFQQDLQLLHALLEPAINAKEWCREVNGNVDVLETKNGFSAFALAVNMGFVEGVALLARAGADVNILDKDGDTPLKVAIMSADLTPNRKIELVDALIKKCRVNCKAGMPFDTAKKIMESTPSIGERAAQKKIMNLIWNATCWHKDFRDECPKCEDKRPEHGPPMRAEEMRVLNDGVGYLRGKFFSAYDGTCADDDLPYDYNGI